MAAFVRAVALGAVALATGRSDRSGGVGDGAALSQPLPRTKALARGADRGRLGPRFGCFAPPLRGRGMGGVGVHNMDAAVDPIASYPQRSG